MINLLICGICGDLETLTKSFNADVRIVAFTDIPKYDKQITYFDAYPYVHERDVKDLPSIDIVLICYSNAEDIGFAQKSFAPLPCVPLEKFKGCTFCDPVTKYFNSKISFKQLIFGMSHSQNALQTHLFTKSTFKFSGPSMDLFCHREFIKQLRDHGNNLNIESVVFELPYYIFNYDLSLSKRSANKRLIYFKNIGNSHNLADKNSLKQFDDYLSIFSMGDPSKITNNLISARPLPLLKRAAKMPRIIKENRRVWEEKREKTISENKTIFSELLSLTASTFPKAKITLVVTPFHPWFRRKCRKGVLASKHMFYSIIEPYHLNVIDAFALKDFSIADFKDHCHLTFEASKRFSLFVDEKLKG